MISEPADAAEAPSHLNSVLPAIRMGFSLQSRNRQDGTTVGLYQSTRGETLMLRRRIAVLPIALALGVAAQPALAIHSPRAMED